MIGSAAAQNKIPAATVVQSVMANQLHVFKRGVASFPPTLLFPNGEKYTYTHIATIDKLPRPKSHPKLTFIKSKIIVIESTKAQVLAYLSTQLLIKSLRWAKRLICALF